ncbi:MAG: Nramp family divalent metal transporter [Verrucomicrobia bacterium]|nr:Nramp family divalent metal transporter [Verrucomicrobiota bacterium]
MSTPRDAPTSLFGALRFIGPGLILTASIVGSGELIVTPKLAGEVGFDLLWLIVAGCVVKVFVQIEIGRFTLAQQKTSLEAFDEVPGPRWRVSWLVWLWLLMYLCAISQVGGIVGGVAETLAAGGWNVSRPVLAIIVGGSCSLLLAVGSYKWVEIGSTAMVAGFTVATVVAVGALQWTEFRIGSSDVVRGLSFHLPQNFGTAFAALGIIGVGASELVYYPYWCLEKGYGVATGRPDGSDAWFARARGWMRVMRTDAWFSAVIYTVATVAFYLLGAAVLHAKKLQVTDKGLIDTLAHMFLGSLGAWSLWVFLAGAFFVLYSTAFAASASNARLLADALSVFGVKKYADEAARVRMVRAACIGLPLYATALYLIWEKPVALVFVGGVGQGIMLPFLGLAALYFRYRRTDVRLRPGGAWSLALWLAVAALALAGAYQVVDLVTKLTR